MSSVDVLQKRVGELTHAVDEGVSKLPQGAARDRKSLKQGDIDFLNEPITREMLEDVINDAKRIIAGEDPCTPQAHWGGYLAAPMIAIAAAMQEQNDALARRVEALEKKPAAPGTPSPSAAPARTTAATPAAAAVKPSLWDRAKAAIRGR